MLAAQAAMPLGWTMVVRQPESIAFSASRRMRNQTFFWIGLSLLVALVAGLFLSRSISLPVRQLVLGASELAKGNFGFRLQMSSPDEFGRLSSTFNHMGAEIEKRESEIQAWNRELLQRVEDRTRELKELQNELLQSKKIAAVSSMGAGIAHEINNPLTAVLGLTQVLLAQNSGEDPEMLETLESIEREAQRIKGIVQNMLALSVNFAGEGFARLSLNEIMDESISLLGWDRETDHIEIVRDYADNLPAVLGNSSNLCQVFMHLFNNSRTAMPDGGRLTLSTSVVEGQLVKVSVADTGKGIDPENLEKILDPFFTTKDNWKSSGLGLTVAFRIVEEHRGKLKIGSTPDVGTTVTITMPAAGRGSHLR
jgi:signal transduction histidine kinase